MSKRIRAVAIFVRKNGRYAAIFHESRNGIEFPAGRVEPRERLETAAVRELHEETGLAVKKMVCVGKLPADVDLTVFVATVTGKMKSSSEGYAFWATKKDLLGPLATYPENNKLMFRRMKR